MPQLVPAVAVVAICAALTCALIKLIRPRLIHHMLAVPNARSSHSVATPQGAGLAVIPALVLICASTLWLWQPAQGALWLAPVLAASLALMVLGALDDTKALSVIWRFIGQGLAALVVCLSLPESVRFFPEILPLVFERALLAIGIVWYINAINFLDGIDWMTVAETVPMTLGIAGLWVFGAIPDAVGILALALLGAMLGFGVFNKHPAQIFLGDAGSLPVGLLLAFMLIVVAATNKTAAILLALYTIADATLTLGRRAWNHEHLFSAHKSHFYQRAVASGFSAPQVTGCVFLLGILLAGLAIAAVLAKTVAANLVLLAIGAGATGLVLYVMARGPK